jgi:hypothetical protein
MAFSSSDFWVFKTLCGLWFIGFCGFSLAFLVAMPHISLFSVFGRFLLFQ